MANRKHKLGKRGENMAVAHLLDKGHVILERNYRYGRGEVDIITRSPEGFIVFVEVKTRSSNHFGYPEEAVSKAQQRLLAKVAEEYTLQIGHEGELRFDIVAINLCGRKIPTPPHIRCLFLL